MNPTIYQKRRKQLLDKIGDGIAVLFSAPEQRRSNDTQYPYRQDSYLYYLSGFPEPESVLLLDGKTGRSTLFCREKDPLRETWDGFRYGPEAAQAVFGVDEAYPLSEWQSRLSEAIKGSSGLYALWGLYPEYDQELMRLWYPVKQAAVQRAVTGFVQAPEVLNDLSRILDPMRQIKDASEIDLLRRAGSISAQAHIRAMRYTRPGLYEYQVEAELLHHFMQNGARYAAYNSIVGGGKNACCLHYVDNNNMLQDGDLLLIDAGGEFENYAGDITRTFPVNGIFSSAQKEVYEIVLAANETAIQQTLPGAYWKDIQKKALETLVQGLIDLKLLSGSLDENIESQAYRRFYMHGLGHWIGLDVHDVGGRYHADGSLLPLCPGMCTTIEPGLYISAAPDIPAEFHDIGIRIEDNVLITENGNDVYTSEVPKTVAEIEALMQRC
ncbi:MAG: aminopeptidase P N-terminal domain-containing protein [Neisseria sp.]|uniref:aminopeptidase P N-terminal domain-containing protein n=1 Tax=Neisseria sp. TaxID=192066 RepID=UPI0026DD699B|nr:aminopeptidase P N-terminal domain-containing protein [Neisseria sp.]MDO4640450.1 aminopeptidase P N-terminal domain-containing protein [Neisseria sp.]